MDRTVIIAEAGVNHNGSLELAKRLIDEALLAGVDIIKFQTFVAEKLVTQSAEKALYQRQNSKESDSQFSMLKKLELKREDFLELKRYCDLKGIEFMSTAFDNESVDFLDEIGMKRWKIPSGEVTNLPYLVKIAGLGKPVYLSTGMCTLKEVGEALHVLKKSGSGEITVLHCTTEYPAPFEDVNLNAMATMRREFGVEVGYSDHTEGFEVPIAAVALGAKVIEKHFTLSKDMEGPDHKASIEPDELRKMVKAIRKIELSLGQTIKTPSNSELKNIAIARKSIVANREILVGEKFTEENITVKRPGTGISPMRWYDVLGKVAKKKYKEDDFIDMED